MPDNISPPDITSPAPPGLRLALVCPPLPSHLRVFEALAAGLSARGHRPALLLERGVALAPGIERVDIPEGGSPLAGLPFFGTIQAGAERTDRLCRHAPESLRGFDAILGDQMEPAGGLIARRLGLPLVSIACALPLDPEPAIPLPFLHWPHDPSPAGLKRNAGGEKVARLLLAPHRKVIRRWSQGAWDSLEDCLAPDLTLAQTVPGFEPPRPHSGWRLIELGPIRPAGPPAPFPDDIVPDPTRPLVYLSLGTLQGHRLRLLARAAKAAREAGAQVLVSLGGAMEPRAGDRIPADWVRPFVPQEAILARADLCITHAGLNTALECLRAGVPMLALPLAFDQPGVAARIEASGTGLRLKPWERSTSRMESAVRHLLTEPIFRTRAAAFRDQAGAWEGLPGAVARIEAYVSAKRAQRPREADDVAIADHQR